MTNASPQILDFLNLSESEIVREFFRLREVTYSGFGLWKMDGKEYNVPKLIDKTYSLYGNVLHNVPLEKGSKGPKKMGVEAWAREAGLLLPAMIESARTELVRSLAFDDNLKSEPLVAYVTLMLARPPTLLEQRVVEHCLWQVKRKALDLPVRDHLWLNLYGPQGTGKSTALHRLFTPWRAFSRTTSLAQLVDEKTYAMYETTLVAFADELAKADRADVETLKHIVTADTVFSRPMRSNEVVPYRNRSTIFSASNEPISARIVDYSGMRRFFELNIPTEMDISAIKTFAAETAWRCVDESKEGGYLDDVDVRADLNATQKKYVAVSPLEEWLELTLNWAHDNGNKEPRLVPMKDLLADANKHLEEHGHRTTSDTVLGRFLSEKKYDVVKGRHGNGRCMPWPHEPHAAGQTVGNVVAMQVRK